MKETVQLSTDSEHWLDCYGLLRKKSAHAVAVTVSPLSCRSELLSLPRSFRLDAYVQFCGGP